MSGIPERVETVRLILPSQEIQNRNLPLVNGHLLDLSPQQVTDIEHDLQATFGYKPGLTAFNFVPLDSSQITPPINPIQVLEYPLSETDALPSNQAIATAGTMWIYWKLFVDALRTGKYDLFNFQSFVMLPIYLDSDNNPLVKIETIQSWNRLYGKSPYGKYAPMINYGGDADFVGSYAPNDNISVTLANHDRVEIPHKDIGITEKAAQEVYDASVQVDHAEDEEITDIIKSKYESLPEAIKKMIDLTLPKYNSLKAVDIVRAYFDSGQANKVALIETLDHLKLIVNSEFAKRISTSQTIKAVDALSDSLEKMYNQALPYYKV